MPQPDEKQMLIAALTDLLGALLELDGQIIEIRSALADTMFGNLAEARSRLENSYDFDKAHNLMNKALDRIVALQRSADV